MEENLISEQEAIMRVGVEKFRSLYYPQMFTPSAIPGDTTTGISNITLVGHPCSYGYASGRICFSMADCEANAKDDCILFVNSQYHIDPQIFDHVIGIVCINDNTESVQSSLATFCRAKGIACVVGIPDTSIEISDQIKAGVPSMKLVSKSAGRQVSIEMGEKCLLDGNSGEISIGTAGDNKSINYESDRVSNSNFFRIVV